MKHPKNYWTESELEGQALAAAAKFRTKRLSESTGWYERIYTAELDNFTQFFEESSYLTDLDSITRLVTTPSLEYFRYCAGPSISEDDLKVIADTSLSTSILSADKAARDRLIEVIFSTLDPFRFPWIAEKRPPTDFERALALQTTTALKSQRVALTQRSNSAQREQEDCVAAALCSAGLTEVDRRKISTLDDAPKPGSFCKESSFGGRKADLVARLPDGRCMPIECKVSNSSTNSVKRLNNDAAAKAVVWVEQFGTAQTVPVAVLEGVFKTHNLIQAQQQGLLIFWSHDLDELINFVKST